MSNAVDKGRAYPTHLYEHDIPAQAKKVLLVSGDGTNSTLDADKLHQYKLSDIEEGATYTYIGYLDKDGAWYIMRIESDETFRYVKGDDSYNWSNRASESYDTFNNVF